MTNLVTNSMTHSDTQPVITTLANPTDLTQLGACLADLLPRYLKAYKLEADFSTRGRATLILRNEVSANHGVTVMVLSDQFSITNHNWATGEEGEEIEKSNLTEPEHEACLKFCEAICQSARPY